MLKLTAYCSFVAMHHVEADVPGFNLSTPEKTMRKLFSPNPPGKFKENMP
jgi:hypothetical protein